MHLADHQIEELARKGMIEPFDKTKLSSYGYDAILSEEFLIPKGSYSQQYLIDPLNQKAIEYEQYRGTSCIIPPHGFVLGRTLEYFYIPRDILVLCIGRSSYARCGIILNITPLEPEWEGYVTIEISNTANLPAVVHANHGISQFIFFRAESNCRVSYKDKKGKYDRQLGVTPSRGL